MKRSNGNSHSLVDGFKDPALLVDRRGTITQSNDSALRLFGYTRQAVLGKKIELLLVIPEKQEAPAKSTFGQLRMWLSENPSFHALHKNGKKICVAVHLVQMKIGNGYLLTLKPTKNENDFVSGNVQKTPTQLRSTLQYARSLIESTPDPLVTISTRGKITDVNEAAIRATGVSREKLVGTDFSNYFTEPKKARDGYQKVFADGYVSDFPLTLRSKEGKLTDVLYNASIYKDDQGNVVGVLAAARDITQLKRSAQYARSLIEASLDPLVTVNPRGKITDVNEASVKATGLPREKLIGTDFSNYFTDPQKARDGYRLVFARGQISDYPLTLKNQNGNLIEVLFNASVYRDEKGNVLGAVAAARDITMMRRTEEQIRKIQAYTRSLIETSLDPQITKGPDGLITDVNEATVQMTGVPREKLIGTLFPSYFTEPAKAEEAYQQAFYKGIVRNYPLAIRHVSGKIADVLYNATVFKDEDGIVQGVFASARDITDRKQAEEELKKRHAYTRSLIEASLDPMVAISSDGKITDVNEALVKATGVERGKLIGTDFSDYFTEPEKAREGYQQIFAKGFVADYPLTISHNLRDVLYNASLYRDEKGDVLGAFASARDITAQRKQEKKIKTLNEELEQRIIELESFSYSVSHDLRAPLRGIDGFIAIFLSKYFHKVDAEGQRLLNNVRRNVNKMGNLIDELLTLSRIGMKDIQTRTINMQELVNTVLDELHETKGRSTVKVRHLETGYGDPALIKQVLVNLISNAFKYTLKKESPVIEIGSQVAEDEIQYYVKDNGVGFDMEYRNKLFGVFQRLHDPQEYQGTGVGLAIVKRIIVRHGGRVWAEGKEGEGATFYFSLPKN